MDQRDLIYEDELAALDYVVDHGFDEGAPPMYAGTDNLVYADEIAECKAVWMGKKPWEKPAGTAQTANNDHEQER